MKLFRNQNGFTGLEVILLVVVVAMLAGGGVYVYQERKNSKAESTTNTTSTKTQADKTVAKPEMSDEEMIAAAVKATPNGMQVGESATVRVNEIVGVNARGSVSLDPTGYAFIAHKADGKWSVVYEGQDEVGKEIGEKYNLPQAWYNPDF